MKIVIAIIICVLIISGGVLIFMQHSSETQPTEIPEYGLINDTGLSGVIGDVLTRQFIGGITEEVRENGVLAEIRMFFDDGTFFIQNIQEDIRRVNEYRIPIHTGVLYLNSDMLYVTVEANTPKELVFELADRYDARILSHRRDNLGEWYSFVFNKGFSREELQRKITTFEIYDFVIEAELSLHFPHDTGAIYLINDSRNDDVNWGLNSINAVGAWEFETLMEDIRVVIFDSSFYSNHNYLDFRFSMSDFFYGIPFWQPEHGTHVAGIIGAELNAYNEMRGITSNSLMYAVPSESFVGRRAKMNKLEWYVRHGGGGSVVINRSMGHGLIEFAASMGNPNAIRYLNMVSREYEAGLLRLIEARHEFVVVTSAGNQHEQDYNRAGSRFIVCMNDCDDCFGFYRDPNGTLAGIDGIYDVFAIIENPEVRSRIITVGAIQQYGNSGYRLANFSQRGRLLDVNAPGFNIYSTLGEPNHYGLMSGTSMASPFVAGLATMIFGINPNLSGAEVRDIIIHTADIQNYNMINASEAVRLVVSDSETGVVVEEDADIVNGLTQTQEDSIRIPMIAVGNVHTVALRDDGTVWAWGANTHSQLGDATTIRRITPVQVRGLDNVIKVASNHAHSVAIRSDGTVWACAY